MKSKKNKFYFRVRLDISRGTEIIGKPFTYKDKVIGKIIDLCDNEAIIEAEKKFQSLIMPKVEHSMSCTAYCYKE